MTDNPLAEWLRARERDHRRDVPDGTDARPSEDGDDGASLSDAHPPPGAIRPPAAPWDDLPPEEPARPRRRWTLFAAALVPWVATGVLLASLGTGDDAATRRGADTTGGDPPAAGAWPTGSQVPSAQASAAVLAVRTTAVAGSMADSEEDPPPRRYIDLAVAEGVTPRGDTAVVTVAATVLEGTADEWQRARPARFGVAVRDTGDGVVAVGGPWPLSTPPPAEELSWERAEIEAEPFEAALVAAGYDRPHGVQLFRSDAVPGVIRAQCRAVAPGEGFERRHAVWVADEPTPVVLGAPESGGPVRQPDTSAR